MFQQNASGSRILRAREVFAKTGLGRTAIYGKISRGEFPRPVQLSPTAVGWLESEVDTWINARVAERDARQRVERDARQPSAA